MCVTVHQVLSGSPRGLQIFRLMETGELVPTIIVLHLLTEAMVTTLKLKSWMIIIFQVEKIYGGKAKGFLLDAFPCNLDQVRNLHNIAILRVLVE